MANEGEQQNESKTKEGTLKNSIFEKTHREMKKI
jgi:hypothetical protein